MVCDETKILRWETQRKEFLAEVLGSLEVGDVDLEGDPFSLLAAVDAFNASQDFGAMDEDDWGWLHTFLAAYIAQIFIVEHNARWEIITDNGRDSYLLSVNSPGGVSRSFDPMELVFNDFHKGLPPEAVRMLATAESITGVTPEVPPEYL
ncbi:hypothetical protein [Nocardia salmonicida]|uniref:hypothetical protein n=1 Tax=Nocardia salmonicida TaxID=53431 RepID=UPI003408E9CF